MSWELDYAKAWTCWVVPEYRAFSPTVKTLIRDIVTLVQDVHQDHDLGITWPFQNPYCELCQRKLRSLDKATLAKAISVVYWAGHWNPNGHAKTLAESWGDDLLMDPAGGYWKFQKLAIKEWCDLYPGERWTDHYAEEPADMKPRFWTHKDGTEPCNEELTYRYRELVKAPLRAVEVRNVNYRPHLFVIGAKHFPKDGGIYIDVHQAPCAVRGCNLSYEEHTSDRVLLLTMTRNWTKQEINDQMVNLKPHLEADKLDGVGFVESCYKELK